jgi:MoxR-like ATPase
MEDLQAMAYPSLRHRILMNFKAEAENITSDAITAELLKTIQRPRGNI